MHDHIISASRPFFEYFDLVNLVDQDSSHAVTQKTTVLKFTLDMPRTNTVFSIFRVWPQIAHLVIIITLLLARFYYHGSDFGSPKAL